jgi:poly-gamma-glutamate synthesis protein (capsule biosynthesis protein)
MAKRLAFLVLIAAALEIAVAVLLGVTAYRVQAAMRQTALAAFRTNLVVNRIAARAAELAQPKTVTLLFVGDIMLARGVEFYTEREGNGDFRFPFAYVSRTLRAADLAVGNLEHPVSDRGRNQGSEYSLRALPRAVEGLADAGFDLVSLANNHIWDWGTDALSDTLTNLDRAGIRHAGAGTNEGSANAPVVMEVNGSSFAFFSWTDLYPEGLEAKGEAPGISRFREDEAAATVRTLSGFYDIVVVLFHFGDEYQTSANESQRHIAEALVDAGADLIVGHHPHVVQEVERYRGGWIAYSLGNFVFDQGFSEETMRGLVLRVTATDGAITAVESLPTRMNEHFQPGFEGL